MLSTINKNNEFKTLSLYGNLETIKLRTGCSHLTFKLCKVIFFKPAGIITSLNACEVHTDVTMFL